MNNSISHSFDVELSLLAFLKEKGYKESTLSSYSNIFSHLNLFLNKKNLDLSCDSINSFIEDVLADRSISSHTKELRISAVKRLADYIDKSKYVPAHFPSFPLTINDSNKKVLDEYLTFCRRSGNKEKTISQKRSAITKFIVGCEKQSMKSVTDISPSIIQKALLEMEAGKRESWPKVALFLRHLATANVIPFDYSAFVPKFNKAKIIPTVYSTEEIKAVEDTIDLNTDLGIRDKAIFLLASRLGIRASDIVRIKMEDLDFKDKKINFVQTKTGVPISLPMIEEIETAIRKYLGVRPESKCTCLFLKARPPYDQVSYAAVTSVVAKYFMASGVDCSHKKHGPRSLRSSLASSMVNDQIPYEVVSRVLGHSGKETVKHYAKLDVEELRVCALAVPEPTGSFKRFLMEGLDIGI